MINHYAYSRTAIKYMLGACCCISGALFLHRIFLIKRYTLRIDCMLTEHQESYIKQFLTTHSINKQFNHELIQKLYKEFSWINCCSLRHTSFNTMLCTIKAAEPLLIVNDFLLLKNNALIPKTIYTDNSIAGLPLITCPTIQKDTDFSTNLKKVLKTIPQEIFEKYNVRCIHETKIELIDKKNPQFIIVIDQHSLGELNLSACNAIQHELTTKGSFNKKLLWFADLRFKNQIVVHSQQERAL